MEMNNSVFHKLNSSSSCFADIKLKRASLKCTSLNTKGSSYFPYQREYIIPRSSGFGVKYSTVPILTSQSCKESQHHHFHGKTLSHST